LFKKKTRESTLSYRLIQGYGGGMFAHLLLIMTEDGNNSDLASSSCRSSLLTHAEKYPAS